MPRAASKPKPNPDVIYVCWSAFCTDAVPGSPVIKSGQRLRGDHPAVLACPFYFVPDGADEGERMAAQEQVYGTEAVVHVPDFPKPPPPLLDEDAVVAIRDVGSLRGDRSGTGQLEAAPNVVLAGQRVSKDADVVNANPDAFVLVVPPGLKRSEALVASVKMGNHNEDDPSRSWHVHAGQWVPRSHPAVRLHPTLFSAPPYVPDEAA